MFPERPNVGGRYCRWIGDVVEESNRTKSRWGKWPYSSSPWGNCPDIRQNEWGPEHSSSPGTRLVGTGQLVGRGVGGNGGVVTRRGRKEQVGNSQPRSGGATENGTGWFDENPSYWNGVGSTSVLDGFGGERRGQTIVAY